MSNNPEKTDKTWNVVAQFLLLLPILVSFLILVLILILSVETWIPKLLESIWVFPIDKPIYKQMFTIILLLASVSLLSFLLQRYMATDPEKADKTWRQAVARFLLLPVLLMSVLMSVLILSVEIWYPELLKPLWEFIEDKQIFTIILLLASVSLLSFLLQRYMNKRPEEVAKIWKIVAYPVHFVLRIAARFLLLAIRSTVLILLLILLVISIVSFKVFDFTLSKIFEWALSQSKETLVENPEPLVLSIITIIIVPIAIVLISHLFQKHAKDIWKSLLNIKERICEVLRDRWLPELDIKKSLSVTRRFYSAKIWSSVIDICTESSKLVFATLILCIAFGGYITMVKYVMPPKEWKIFLLTFVYIPDHSHPDIEEKLGNHPHPAINKEIPDHSHKPSTSYRFEKGTQFSLFYKEGNLKTKKDSLEIEDGICPEGSNLEWLRLFKTAITDSLKDKDGYLKLKVRGFASVAPVLVNGDPTKSNSLNCEIANRRAEALIYFLTLPDSIPYDLTECKSALEDSSSMWGRQENELCTRSAMLDTNAWKERGFDLTYETRSDTIVTIVWKGPKFDVVHKPWQSYEEMDRNKPEKNPLENSKNKEDRQLDREFLNRSVQITIEDGSDWTETIPTPPAENNTGPN